MASAANLTMPSSGSSRPGASQQMSILEVFIPGISHISGAMNQLFAGDLNVFAYLVCGLGLIGFIQSYLNRLFSRIQPYFTSTIHIRPSDEVSDMVSFWLTKRGLNESARSCLARVSKERSASEIVTKGKKSLVYKPWQGTVRFWYRGHLVSYGSQFTEGDGFNYRSRREERITLTCLGWSTDVLKKLLGECRHDYLEQVRGKTTIFENRRDNWKKLEEKDIRPLSTVILNKSEKEPLLDDIRGFLSEETRLWYTQRALPYRRGYLLYGPPGTGKSSLSLSLAGEFELDIYVVSIPDATNLSLKDLFEELPEKCVVLLEDIDAVGMARQSEVEVEEEPEDEKASRAPKGQVTLSGLLNILDGVTSQDGRIVIMTTNHREKLDEALIRPGRIDLQVEFQLADKEVIVDLFYFLFGPLKTQDESKKAEEESAVRAKAAEFAEKVPSSTFSQAEVISYMLLYKNQPDAVVENCEKWVERVLEEKRVAAEAKLGNGK